MSRRRRMNMNGGAFSPSQVSSLVAHWSGAAAATDGGLPSITNNLGGTVGALAQGTANDVPAKRTLANGIGAFVTDGGSGTDDTKTTDVAALRFTEKGYWAFWLSLGPSCDPNARLLSQWAEGGSAERLDITYETSSSRFAVSIATSATTLVLQRFNVTRATLSVGAWVEFLYDGSEAAEDDRFQVYVNDVRVSRASTTGNNPTELQAGDATNLWVGSRNGANNGSWYIAHLYIGNDIPTTSQRAQLKGYQQPDFSWAHSIVIAGNSIMAGFGLARDEAPDYLLQQSLGNTYGVHLQARDGATTAQQSGEFAVGTDHLVRAGGTNIVVFMEVGNHLIGGATAAAAQTAVEDMAAAVQALGWLFVLCTTMPRTVGVASWTSQMETDVSDMNAAWRLDHSFADGFVDLAGDARLSDPSNTTYIEDGRHPTVAGAVVIEELVLAEVEAILAA